MKEQFEQYLIRMGYKEYTPSGKPSTVYDYSHRIDAVCKWECTDWDGLAQRIDDIVCQYEIGGSKEQLGSKSHNAVRSALRCYRAFLRSR